MSRAVWGGHRPGQISVLALIAAAALLVAGLAGDLLLRGGYPGFGQFQLVAVSLALLSFVAAYVLRDVAMPAHQGLAVAIAVVYLATSALNISSDLAANLAFGGHQWKQGDWLINWHEQMTRRGLIGSMFLEAGDLLGVSALTLVVIVQTVLVWSIAAHAAVLLVTFKGDLALALALLCSPVFALGFFDADPHGAVRKELLLYAALSMLALAPALTSAAWRRSYYVLSFLLFFVSIAGNEGLLPFSLIFLLVALYLYRRESRVLGATMAAMLMLAVSGVLLVALLYGTADPQRVCAPLLARGMSEKLCGGAIDYLVTAYLPILERTSGIFATYWPDLLLVGLLSAMPLFALLRAKWCAAVVACTAACVLPLFVFAIDWGRWITIFYTSSLFLSFFVLRALGAGMHAIGSQRGFALVIFIFNTGWSIRHCCTPKISEYHGLAAWLLSSWL